MHTERASPINVVCSSGHYKLINSCLPSTAVKRVSRVYAMRSLTNNHNTINLDVGRGRNEIEFVLRLLPIHKSLAILVVSEMTRSLKSTLAATWNS